MKLHNTRLLVNDFDKCFEFYSEIMKFEITWGKKGEAYATFNTGDTGSIAIYPKSLMHQSLKIEEPDTTTNSQFVLCFESDNIDDDYKTLLSAGVTFLDKPTNMTHWGIRCAHLTDPEGNILEIYQELPQEEWSSELK